MTSKTWAKVCIDKKNISNIISSSKKYHLAQKDRIMCKEVVIECLHSINVYLTPTPTPVKVIKIYFYDDSKFRELEQSFFKIFYFDIYFAEEPEGENINQEDGTTGTKTFSFLDSSISSIRTSISLHHFQKDGKPQMRAPQSGRRVFSSTPLRIKKPSATDEEVVHPSEGLGDNIIKPPTWGTKVWRHAENNLASEEMNPSNKTKESYPNLYSGKIVSSCTLPLKRDERHSRKEDEIFRTLIYNKLQCKDEANIQPDSAESNEHSRKTQNKRLAAPVDYVGEDSLGAAQKPSARFGEKLTFAYEPSEGGKKVLKPHSENKLSKMDDQVKAELNRETEIDEAYQAPPETNQIRKQAEKNTNYRLEDEKVVKYSKPGISEIPPVCLPEVKTQLIYEGETTEANIEHRKKYKLDRPLAFNSKQLQTERDSKSRDNKNIEKGEIFLKSGAEVHTCKENVDPIRGKVEGLARKFVSSGKFTGPTNSISNVSRHYIDEVITVIGSSDEDLPVPPMKSEEPKKSEREGGLFDSLKSNLIFDKPLRTYTKKNKRKTDGCNSDLDEKFNSHMTPGSNRNEEKPLSENTFKKKYLAYRNRKTSENGLSLFNTSSTGKKRKLFSHEDTYDLDFGDEEGKPEVNLAPEKLKSPILKNPKFFKSRSKSPHLIEDKKEKQSIFCDVSSLSGNESTENKKSIKGRSKNPRKTKGKAKGKKVNEDVDEPKTKTRRLANLRQNALKCYKEMSSDNLNSGSKSKSTKKNAKKGHKKGKGSEEIVKKPVLPDAQEDIMRKPVLPGSPELIPKAESPGIDSLDRSKEGALVELNCSLGKALEDKLEERPTSPLLQVPFPPSQENSPVFSDLPKEPTHHAAIPISGSKVPCRKNEVLGITDAPVSHVGLFEEIIKDRNHWKELCRRRKEEREKYIRILTFQKEIALSFNKKLEETNKWMDQIHEMNTTLIQDIDNSLKDLTSTPEENMEDRDMGEDRFKERVNLIAQKYIDSDPQNENLLKLIFMDFGIDFPFR